MLFCRGLCSTLTSQKLPTAPRWTPFYPRQRDPKLERYNQFAVTASSCRTSLELIASCKMTADFARMYLWTPPIGLIERRALEWWILV
eukprot:IDg16125t1